MAREEGSTPFLLGPLEPNFKKGATMNPWIWSAS